MRVVLRADASVSQGSGHVMRCLTLAEELQARDHEVHLVGGPSGIDWLDTAIASTVDEFHHCEPNGLDVDAIKGIGPDWVVVDSYLVDRAEISRLNSFIPVLAIVDGDTRGIDSSLYLEQNLGSEHKSWQIPHGSEMLAGSSFALVRDAILEQRRPQAWRIDAVPRLVAFMGGTDPTGAIVKVASQLAKIAQPISLTVIAPEIRRAEIELLLSQIYRVQVVTPTPDLPSLLGHADIAISAAGTSAWDICSLGLPAVFIALVDNQRESLREVMRDGLALGLDLGLEGESALNRLPLFVDRLLEDALLRQSLSRRSLGMFDGRGKGRVVDAMEQFVRG